MAKPKIRFGHFQKLYDNFTNLSSTKLKVYTNTIYTCLNRTASLHFGYQFVETAILEINMWAGHCVFTRSVCVGSSPESHALKIGYTGRLQLEQSN